MAQIQKVIEGKSEKESEIKERNERSEGMTEDSRSTQRFEGSNFKT